MLNYGLTTHRYRASWCTSGKACLHTFSPFCPVKSSSVLSASVTQSSTRQSLMFSCRRYFNHCLTGFYFNTVLFSVDLCRG